MSIRYLIAGLVVLLSACGTYEQAQVEDDVKLTKCTTYLDGFGATVRVTNNGTDRADYYVEVNFSDSDSGDYVDWTNTTIVGLAPGQSATDELTSHHDTTGLPDAKCSIVDVSRR